MWRPVSSTDLDRRAPAPVLQARLAVWHLEPEELRGRPDRIHRSPLRELEAVPVWGSPLCRRAYKHRGAGEQRDLQAQVDQQDLVRRLLLQGRQEQLE